MPRPVQFEATARDVGSLARCGVLSTPHGSIETPAFMPVGTQATVKGILPDQLRGTGSRMILANTYHLALRPGDEEVKAMGGLHAFMDWDGPILTDSGGFQVFSLAARAKITEAGASFRSHLDGSLLELTPERAVAIQENLGADVAMCLDVCPALPASRRRRSPRPSTGPSDGPSVASEATLARIRPSSGSSRGASHADLRQGCAEALIALDFDGYAVGGVSVGEGRDQVRLAMEVTAPYLPEDRPRYLMGVGRPQDILDAIATGIDLFDCVLPTRNGRNATCLTASGNVKLRNAGHRRDPRPIEEGCECLACRRFSRAYLRHLFIANEMLGPILASIHNLTRTSRR